MEDERREIKARDQCRHEQKERPSHDCLPHEPTGGTLAHLNKLAKRSHRLAPEAETLGSHTVAPDTLLAGQLAPVTAVVSGRLARGRRLGE